MRIRHSEAERHVSDISHRQRILALSSTMAVVVGLLGFSTALVGFLSSTFLSELAMFSERLGAEITSRDGVFRTLSGAAAALLGVSMSMIVSTFLLNKKISRRLDARSREVAILMRDLMRLQKEAVELAKDDQAQKQLEISFERIKSSLMDRAAVDAARSSLQSSEGKHHTSKYGA